MQRAHWMQRSRSSQINSPSGTMLLEVLFLIIIEAALSRTELHGQVLKRHSPPLSQTGQSSGCEVSKNSTVPF
jgi:hypothetical protein